MIRSTDPKNHAIYCHPMAPVVIVHSVVCRKLYKKSLTIPTSLSKTVNLRADNPVSQKGQKDQRWPTKYYKENKNKMTNTKNTVVNSSPWTLGSTWFTCGTRRAIDQRYEYHRTQKACWTTVCVNIYKKIQHEHSTKQMRVKTIITLFSSGNRIGIKTRN